MIVRSMVRALTVAIWAFAFGCTGWAQDVEMGKRAFAACAPCGSERRGSENRRCPEAPGRIGRRLSLQPGHEKFWDRLGRKVGVLFDFH
jgi:cytochrome c2